MGTIYRAEDTRTHRLVAIKLLKPEALLSEPNLLERFWREGEALRQLNHPNIVKSIEAFEDAGLHYLVMEYVDGNDLQVYMQKNRLTIEQVLNMAIDIADALTRAHRLNIIHRDIKPANILIASNGSVLLTDFGVAHWGTGAQLTENKSMVGTLAYLSPEAFEGKEATAQTDIWSFGVLLFEMLTRQRPFYGSNVVDLISNILFHPTPDLEALAPDAPTALVDLIYRMLAKNPVERIPSVRVVSMELEAILQNNTGYRRFAPSYPAVEEDATFVVGSRFNTPTPVTHTAKHNLPAQTTAFVGREAELQELTRLVDDPDTRLITILGPGGMGKSRLALELAQKCLSRFVNGVYFVELAPLSNPENIVSEIGKALGYSF
jgi:serine/threonine-protein kinase